jgi:hypothetical protein
MVSTAIFALTRGYPEPKGYRLLIERNKAITRSLSTEMKESVDFVLFHEGNIPLDHQNAICSASGVEIRFISVGDAYERWNESNPYEEYIGRRNSYLVKATPRDIDTNIPWCTGYRNMCHFYAVHCIELLGQLGYSYALRIDEDCIFESSLDMALGGISGHQEYLIGTPAMFRESHRLTNYILPGFLRLTGIDYSHTWRHSYYESSPMVYSNVNLYYIKNILSDRLCLRFLQVLNNSGIIHRCRAGDAPLLFWLSQTRANGLRMLSGARYQHLSHKMGVDDGKVLR